MRLSTRALLAILPILLPSGSEAASLPHGSLYLSDLEEELDHPWWQNAPSRAFAAHDEYDRLDDFGSFGDFFVDSRPADGRAVAAASSQQQPERHVASPSSSSALVSVPAHRSQAQARPAYQPPQQGGGQFREHRAGNAAHNQRTLQPVMGTQRDSDQGTPQRITAAQKFNLPKDHNLANFEVVHGDNGLFKGKSLRTSGGPCFDLGTEEQRALILKRYKEKSQTTSRISNWEEASRHVPRPQREIDFFNQVTDAAAALDQSRFRDTPYLEPYFIGDYIIYFRKRRDALRALHEVYAVPTDESIKEFVGKRYVVKFIGTLETTFGRRNNEA